MKRRFEDLFGVERQRLLLLLLISLTLAAVCISEETLHPYHIAMKCLHNGEYENGIIAYYKYLLHDDPMLSIESRRTDLEPAMEFLRCPVSEPQAKERRQLLKALIERILLNFSAAENHLNDLWRRHQSSLLLGFLRGEFFLAQDKLEQAVEAFESLKVSADSKPFTKMAEKLLEKKGHDPSEVTWRCNMLRRALRHIDLFERTEGEKLLRLILKEYPDDAEASRSLTELLIEMERYDEAMIVLEDQKSVLGPAGVPAHLEAWIHFNKGAFPPVVEILAPLEEMLEEISLFHYAESLFQIGRLHDALPRYEILRANDPENTGFTMRVVACNEAMERFQSATDILISETSKFPSDQLLKIELAGIFERAGRYDDAIREYRAAIDVSGPFDDLAREELNLIFARQQEERIQQEIEGRSGGEFTITETDSGQLNTSSVSPDANERLIRRQNDLTTRLRRLYD